MQRLLVKVPFGPVIVVYDDEFHAVMRHRTMLFFYFGIVCLILVTVMGRIDPLGQPELVLGLAAIEVLVGIFIVVLAKSAVTISARRSGRQPFLHLGWVLVPTVLIVMLSAEVLEPFLFDGPRSTPLEFGLKVLFYLALVELLLSIMLQFTVAGILADLRRGTDREGISANVAASQRPEKSA